jgi:cell division protein FtsW (lipid II flippase)
VALLVSFISILVYLWLSIKNPKIFLVILVIYLLLCYFFMPKNLKRTMAQKKLGEYENPNEDYIHAPITQPAVES